MEPPELYQQSVAQNKFGYCMGIWLLGNAVNNGLMSTGAFEVYYDGSLVWPHALASCPLDYACYFGP